MDNALLSKVIKDALKGGKSAMGAKEVISSMKGSKAVLCTRSIPQGLGSKIREEAKKQGVQIIELPHSSADLARLVGRPYKVSAMTLRSISESEIKQLMR